MGNFRVVQFSRYFAVSREPRKLKSAKYFPSLTNHLFTCIQNNNCVFICVSIDQRSLNVKLHVYTFLLNMVNMNRSIRSMLVSVQMLHNRRREQAGKIMD